MFMLQAIACSPHYFFLNTAFTCNMFAAFCLSITTSNVEFSIYVIPSDFPLSTAFFFYCAPQRFLSHTQNMCDDYFDSRKS